MFREEEMIPLIEQYFNNKGYLTFTEVSVSSAGHGVADVVAVKLNKDKVLQRVENNQFTTLKSSKYIELLKFISEDDEGTSLDELASNFSFSKTYLKNNLLKVLIDDSYVVPVSRNNYRKINHIIPLASEVIAVEAKLENWVGGLKQARRYQFYANRVYLALLSDYCHRVNEEKLKKHNIGLIEVCLEKEDCQVHLNLDSDFKPPVVWSSNVLAHEAIWQRIRHNPIAFV